MKSSEHACLFVACAWMACGCAYDADSGQLEKALTDAGVASTTIPADETQVTLDALLSPPA